MTRAVPRWGLVSAAAAPVLLVGGFTLAARLAPDGFDQVSATISALAARDAAHREVMTVALAGLGVCHVVTSAALRPARNAGRLVLAAGGIATVGAAGAPLPAGGGSSTLHVATAAAAFASLAAWPSVAWPVPPGASGVPVPTAKGLLSRRAGLSSSVGLLALTGWLVGELVLDRGVVGLAERVAATAQALWPLAVAVSLARGGIRPRDRNRPQPRVSLR